MKRSSFFISVWLLISLMHTNLYACQKILINGSKSWYPVSFRDDNQQLMGIAPDTAKAVFKRIGIAVHMSPDLPWKRQLRALSEGEIDMIAGAYFTDERDIKYRYTEDLLSEKIKVFTDIERAFSFQNWSDLENKRGLRVLGGSYGTAFDTYAAEHLSFEELYHQNEMIIRTLKDPRVDYSVLSEHDGYLTAKKLGLENRFVALEKPVAELSIHFLFSRKSKCIHRIGEINQVILDVKNEALIAEITEAYLTQ